MKVSDDVIQRIELGKRVWPREYKKAIQELRGEIRLKGVDGAMGGAGG